MVVTLNYIIEKFKEFATNHYSISSIEIDEYDNFKSENHQYPLMYLLDDSPVFTPSLVKPKFIVMFLDRVVDKIPSYQVRSEMLMIVEDFITEFSSENSDIYNFEVDYNNIEAKAIYDKMLQDTVTGYRLEITIEVFSSKNLNTVGING